MSHSLKMVTFYYDFLFDLLNFIVLIVLTQHIFFAYIWYLSFAVFLSELKLKVRRFKDMLHNVMACRKGQCHKQFLNEVMYHWWSITMQKHVHYVGLFSLWQSELPMNTTGV